MLATVAHGTRKDNAVALPKKCPELTFSKNQANVRFFGFSPFVESV